MIPSPVVHVSRLSEPMPIDADIAKWRRTGIVPQVIITPETATGAITGPRDACAVIRLGYEGQDLYLQALYFDDIASFHQPQSRYYLQECLEICINGFNEGLKFDFTHTTDQGDLVMRGHFGGSGIDRAMTPKEIPRLIKVLDDASEVPERELIESVYGVDMTKSKVIVMEMKLPITKETFAPLENQVFELKPGASFWLGMLLDDNDIAGTDVQNFMVWPVTYGTFSPKETGAKVVLE